MFAVQRKQDDIVKSLVSYSSCDVQIKDNVGLMLCMYLDTLHNYNIIIALQEGKSAKDIAKVYNYSDSIIIIVML